MMLALGWLGGLFSVVLIFISLLMIGLILLQKNRGSGLSGAFGGAGGHSAFGTKTGDFLTWVTVSFAGVFLLLSVVLNYMFEPTTAAGTAPSSVVTQSPAQPGTPGTNGPMPIKIDGAGKAVPITAEEAQKAMQKQTTPNSAAPVNPAPADPTPANPAPANPATTPPAGSTAPKTDGN